MESATFATATELARAIRAGDISATEVLSAHLAQIERHNPALNAVVILDAERALTRAREADAALARGEVWGPLHGVPFTLKDAHAVAGMRSTIGFPAFDHVPERDGAVAARLHEAGAVLIGKTNVASMLADFQTDNPIFGRTNNPWDTARTPGGSGGGAAAAVAAGLTPFDIGTDLSGSIRLPAHYCGVFGLKPTERRVSLDGVFPDPFGTPRSVRIMSCVGPLARSIDDLALLLAIIAAPDERDSETAPVPLSTAPEPALSTLRIAVAPTLPGLPVATEVREAVLGLASQLASLGATVEEVTLPTADVTNELERTGELFGMILGAFQPNERESPTTLADYFAALQRRDEAIAAWERFFASWDALLCPTAMNTAFHHCAPGTPLPVNGSAVEYYTVSAHATLFNYTGHPALTLPYTQDRDGLPLGVQLVGKRWDEGRLLALGAAVSRVAGGWRRPAGY